MKPARQLVRLARLTAGTAFVFRPGLMGRGTASPGDRGRVKVPYEPDAGVGVVWERGHPDDHRRTRERIEYVSGYLQVEVVP